MNGFFEKHLGKLLGSAGIMSFFQFGCQLHEYFSDGQLDHHEIEQLFLSTTSGAQSVIMLVVIVFLKYFKK